MKKWHIYIIIFVISIALMGLIYVQSIYIQRALVIQNTIFETYANEAMVRTAIRIEEEEATQLLNSSQYNNLYNQTQSINGNCGLNLQYQNGIIILDVVKGPDTYTFKGQNLQDIDSLVKMAQLGNEIEAELTHGLLNSYNDMVENMTMQFLYGNNSAPVFDSSKIFNYLSYELERIGINTDFEFALIDGYTFKKLISTIDKLTPEIRQEAYKTPIHTSFFNDDHAILMVQFPNKKSYLLKSNSQLLKASFFFIILIAAAFGASLLIIFKQKKLSELKTDFINNMTHELKTPVATISLATEMLNKEKVRDDKDKVMNYNKIISLENKRLGTHIERVLQIAQLDKDELKLSKETVDVNEIINDLLIKFQLRLDDVDAEINTDLKALKTKFRADKTHIINMFSNLIDNAIKYSSDERKLNINIVTENIKDTIVFKITDNGIGMNKSDQKKIFTKFYRVPTGNIHNVKGFGLGLSYVKTIIEAHKGTIEVNSEPNKYTTFIVSLPTTNKLNL